MRARGKSIVSSYAHMWPRAVFAEAPQVETNENRKAKADAVSFLDNPGVYVLYRGDPPTPCYVGQGDRLRSCLKRRALSPRSMRFLSWNFFSAFVVPNKSHRNDLQAILMAIGGPMEDGAKPQLAEQKMPKWVCDLPRDLHSHHLLEAA